jgi:putative transposase
MRLKLFDMKKMQLLKNLASSRERKTLPDTKHNLSQNKQCQLLHISKSSLYYIPTKQFAKVSDLKVLDAINNIYSDFPSYGSRRIHSQLLRDGYRSPLSKA